MESRDNPQDAGDAVGCNRSLFATLQVMSVVFGATGLPVRGQLKSGGEWSLGPRLRTGLASLPQEPGPFRWIQFAGAAFLIFSVRDDMSASWMVTSAACLCSRYRTCGSRREIALDHCTVQEPFCQAWLRDEAGAC